MEFEEPVYEEINDKKEYKEMPKSEKRKSRELKVIPSPTNSLERNISGLEAVKNSPKRSKSKRSHSEELAKGGLLKVSTHSRERDYLFVYSVYVVIFWVDTRKKI